MGQRIWQPYGRPLSLPGLSLARLAPRPNVLAQPLIDDCSNAGVRSPGALSDHLGNVWLQVNRDIQFDTRSVELAAFALRQIIFLLHRVVFSYCLASRLVAFRAEIIRIFDSSAEASENVWTMARTLPWLSRPMVTHLSSASLCSWSKTDRAKGSRKSSVARSKLIPCLRRFSFPLMGSHSKL